MKTILSFGLLLIFSAPVFSQSDRYVSAMQKNVAQLDSVMVKNNATELINNFQRIADAEKTQWLPYYYAAYLTAMQAVMTQDNSQKDVLADKAESLLTKAQQAYGKENSELLVIQSLIATARLTVDPQGRYMVYGPQINTSIQKAKALDPTNPRPVLLEAQNIFYTPEAFGGGKKAAEPLFEQAQKLFENFKPENDLSPDWGKSSLDFFMKNYE